MSCGDVSNKLGFHAYHNCLLRIAQTLSSQSRYGSVDEGLYLLVTAMQIGFLQ